MPMGYRIYLERRKALDEDCAKTAEEYAQASARLDHAVARMDAAEANLDQGTDALRGWRERDLLGLTDRKNAAATALDTATDKRDDALAKRKDLEGEYPEFEDAAKQQISPEDPNAPADIKSRRETVMEVVEQVKGTMETGLMTGGMIAKILTGTPDVHEQATPVPTIEQVKQEVASEVRSLDQHQTLTYEARVTTPPGEIPTEISDLFTKKEREEEREEKRQKELAEGRDKEEEKSSVEKQIEAIGGEEHITSAEDLKKKNEKMLEDLAESSRHPSFPDPEKSAELIAKHSSTVANDNHPPHEEPTSHSPANDNAPGHRGIPAADKPVAMPAHANAGAGMPDPDPPASALAARAPANDNNPHPHANDNDNDL
jgi:hypothetical protein